MPTVVAEVVSDAEAAADERAAQKVDDRVLLAMERHPDGTYEEWATDCGLFVRGDPLRPNKDALYRIMKRLQHDKLVTKRGRSHVLTKDGAAAAAKARPSTGSSATKED